MNDAKPWGVVSNQGSFKKRILLRAKHTGAWMSVRGTMVTDTVLTATEFRNFKCDSYNVNPPNPQNKCDGYLRNVLVHHTLICSNGGLVIACHNGIHDNIIYINRQAFYPH